jgi:hypothetical protein
MAYAKTQTISNNPNIGSNSPFVAQNSNQADLFANVAAHGGGSMGVGSFKVRSLDEALKLYRPYDTAVSSMVAMLGAAETVNNVVHEWGEDDELLPFDITGDATPENAADVINNVAGGTPYVPAATAVHIEVTAAEAKKARVNRKIRYVNASGTYTYAVITAIIDTNSVKGLQLSSLDGSTTLPLASAAAVPVQILESSFGSDLNYDPQPMGANPKMYYTYLQQLIGFGKWTERSENEANLFDQKQRAMEQAMADFNRQLETNTLYGTRAKRELTSQEDYQYFSEGIHDTTKAQNYHSSDLTTGGNFDASKFRKALYNFVKYNYGAESGGPKVRQMFIDGSFSNMLDQAFEDKQRFEGNSFVGGVMVSRFEISDGIIDFVRNPFFEIQHPLPNASLRQSGTPLAYGILLPVGESLTRLTFQGEGVRDDTYRVNGGDVEQIYRIRGTVGTKHALRQYCAVFEQTAE